MCVYEGLCLASAWRVDSVQRVGGQLELFNGSYDITFSLDYRRLDDGSPPVYSNNRWADRKDLGMCVCV